MKQGRRHTLGNRMAPCEKYRNKSARNFSEQLALNHSQSYFHRAEALYESQSLS